MYLTTVTKPCHKWLSQRCCWRPSLLGCGVVFPTQSLHFTEVHIFLSAGWCGHHDISKGSGPLVQRILDTGSLRRRLDSSPWVDCPANVQQWRYWGNGDGWHHLCVGNCKYTWHQVAKGFAISALQRLCCRSSVIDLQLQSHDIFSTSFRSSMGIRIVGINQNCVQFAVPFTWTVKSVTHWKRLSGSTLLYYACNVCRVLYSIRQNVILYQQQVVIVKGVDT